MNRTALWILAASLTCCGLQAQTNPLVKEMRSQYDAVKANLLKAADKMSEENYAFKPTPEMRTFGALIGHIAGQIRTCAQIKGEQKSVDTSKTAKADMVAALKASFAECDAAWDSMETGAMEMISGRGGQRTKLSALIQSTIIHNNEEYGYMCPYMRLKGVTPPSSDRAM